MNDAAKKPAKEQNVQVKIPEQLNAPVYANTVSVNASDTETVINFIYIDPNNKEAVLVSRVAVPRSMLMKIRDLMVEVAEAVGVGKK